MKLKVGDRFLVGSYGYTVIGLRSSKAILECTPRDYEWLRHGAGCFNPRAPGKWLAACIYEDDILNVVEAGGRYRPLFSEVTEVDILP